MFLADVEFTHQPQPHEAFAGTAFGVAVVEIPCCGFERGSLVSAEAVGAVGVGVLGLGLLGFVVVLAFWGEVFFVADHGRFS